MEKTSPSSARPAANVIILIVWALGFKLLIESGIGWYSGADYEDLKVTAAIALFAPIFYTGIAVWMLAKLEFYMLTAVIGMTTLAFFILLAITILPSY